MASFISLPPPLLLPHKPKTPSLYHNPSLCSPPKNPISFPQRLLRVAAAAAPPELEAPTPAAQVLEEDDSVEKSVGVLKTAAKARRVPREDVLAALDVIKKSKTEPDSFLETLGGSASPGRTWMLIFTSEGRLKKGRYFPVTAVQRFDAAAKRIENGIYLGPIGCLTFEGKFTWKKKILAFIFESVRIKIGPFNPLQISLKGDDREPSTKDPFFIWFYIDEEIAVAQGRGGGVAFWCRCRHVT